MGWDQFRAERESKRKFSGNGNSKFNCNGKFNNNCNGKFNSNDNGRGNCNVDCDGAGGGDGEPGAVEGAAGCGGGV
jgi:hypothetical protein